MTNKQPIYAKYIGAGNFVAGVPACDMTEEDWRALSPEKQKEALDAGTHKLNFSGKKPAAEEGE